MMAPVRSYLSVVLAALLVLAALGEAKASVMRDASGQMVICTGTGPVTIYVDEAGQPAAPPHSCPDCISLTLDAGLTGFSAAAVRAAPAAYQRPGPRQSVPVRASSAARARAPPAAA